MTHQVDLVSVLLKLSFKLRLVLAFGIDLLASLFDFLSDVLLVPLAQILGKNRVRLKEDEDAAPNLLRHITEHLS